MLDKQTGWSGNWRMKVYYLRMGRNAGPDSFVQYRNRSEGAGSDPGRYSVEFSLR